VEHFFDTVILPASRAKSTMRILMAAMLIVGAFMLPTHAQEGNSLSSFGLTDVVTTTSGPVSGEVLGISADKPFYSFKSIPYASALRWEAPQDPEPWLDSEPLNATTFGPICPQPDPSTQIYGRVIANYTGLNEEETATTTSEMSEDECLTLNVYSPTMNETANLPVMVWIHGGALIVGTGQDYPPESLVGQDVVLVTINYRLGFLGYFAHPELGDATNFGLLDQVKALEWVQKNIAAFGGDPDRVTIFGESAGGTSVLALMVSPLSEGLFSGAIAQSAFIPESLGVNVTQAGSLGVEVGALLGAAEGEGQLEKMKSIPSENFATAINEMGGKYGGAAFIYVDGGATMPSSIWDGFKQGLNHKGVPLIVGSNANETAGFSATVDAIQGNWFGNKSSTFYKNESQKDELEASFTGLGGTNPDTVEGYKEMVERIFGKANAEEVMKILPVTQDSQAKPNSIQIQTDVLFGLPSYFVATSMANRSEPVFAYMFNQQAEEIGAFHGYDVYHVFNMSIGLAPLPNPDLANAMVIYWTDFAKSGDPNSGGTLPTWSDFKEGATWQMLGPEISSSKVPEDLATIYELARNENLYPDAVVPVVTDGIGWPAS
jgi:para-nitrobenzyl esterase